MNRSVVRCCTSLALFALATSAFAPPPAARAQAVPSTSAAAAPPSAESVADPETPAPPPQPPQCRFDDLLRVELRDRKLRVVMTPPKALADELAAGDSAAVAIVDSDAFDWRISAAREDDDAGAENAGASEAKVAAAAAGEGGAADADEKTTGYARFSVSASLDQLDRWSPLQLVSVTADDALEIVGGGRMGRTSVSVIYRQDRKLNAARLTVQRSRRGGAGRPLHDFTGADLLQIWNEHQRECRTFLVPLLKTIAPRENLLRPRAGDVYRAFDAIPADPAVTRRVAALLPGLEAESPAARAAASAEIEALGAAGVLAVLRMDRDEWTPEQTARLGAIVRRQSTLADPRVWRRDIYFLTDCLEDPDAAVRQSALESVRAVAGRAVEFDLAAAPAARSAAAQEILRTLESTTASGR